MGKKKQYRLLTALTIATLTAAGAVVPAVSAEAAPRPMAVVVRATTTDADRRHMQAVVDAGGQVAVRYGAIKRTIVSAHDFSDARALSLHRGDLVTFRGKLTGTYRVTGAMRVRTGSSSSQVLKLRTKLMMQTCVPRTNTSRIVGLTPVGSND